MKKLNREDRRQALKGCFEVHSADSGLGRAVLLIDDIMTTGATLEVCSQALLDSGAVEVWTMTFATVYDNQPSADKSFIKRIRQLISMLIMC